MDKSNLFILAHHNTRLKVLKNALLGRKKIKYNIIFKYELKKAIAAQAVKTTVYDGNITRIEYKPKVNKSVAMIGDYKKPTIVRDGLKVRHIISPSLSVTYNLDNLLSLVICAITVISFYYIALQAITN